MKQPDANKDEITIVKGHIQLENGHVKEAIRSFLSALQSTSFSHDIFFRIAISVYDCGYPAIAYPCSSRTPTCTTTKATKEWLILQPASRLSTRKPNTSNVLKQPANAIRLKPGRCLASFIPKHSTRRIITTMRLDTCRNEKRIKVTRITKPIINTIQK